MNNENIKPEDIELSPSYNLPVILLLIGIALSFWNIIGGIITTLIGLFLLIQASIIKLKFTSTALDIYRQQTKIRSFPYTDWENWLIFTEPIPILLYFKEVKSIHFLPIIFDPLQLKYCLTKYCQKVVKQKQENI